MSTKLVKKTWADAIREWLVENERTQSWLARHCKPPMGDAYFNRILSGEQSVTPYALERLEAVTGLQLVKLWKQEKAA